MVQGTHFFKSPILNIKHINTCGFLSTSRFFLPLMGGVMVRNGGCETGLTSGQDAKIKLDKPNRFLKQSFLSDFRCGQTEPATVVIISISRRSFVGLAGRRLKAQQRPLVADWWTVFFLFIIQSVASVNSGVICHIPSHCYHLTFCVCPHCYGGKMQ